jgi:hypothetical protein
MVIAYPKMHKYFFEITSKNLYPLSEIKFLYEYPIIWFTASRVHVHPMLPIWQDIQRQKKKVS